MIVTINGNDAAVPEGATVLTWLEGRGLPPDVVVVELNGGIVPGDEFGRTELNDGDVLEVLRFVGGG